MKETLKDYVVRVKETCIRTYIVKAKSPEHAQDVYPFEGITTKLMVENLPAQLVDIRDRKELNNAWVVHL